MLKCTKKEKNRYWSLFRFTSIHWTFRHSDIEFDLVIGNIYQVNSINRPIWRSNIVKDS